MLSSLMLRIKHQVLKQDATDQNFIFCIGLSKTGTTSVYHALQILGYQAYDNPPITRVTDRKQILVDLPWWFHKYEAFTDLSVAACCQELADRFPRARFILSTREKASWLDSCRRHFTLELAERREKQGNHWMNHLGEAFYGSHTFDKIKFGDAYDRHHELVTAAFSTRPLLIQDFTVDPSWTRLCRYLGKEIPDASFPHSNVGTRQNSSCLPD